MLAVTGTHDGVRSAFILFILILFSLFEQDLTLSLQHVQSPKSISPSVGKVPKAPRLQMKNVGRKTILSLDAFPNARCLDGTPGGYYFSKGLNAEGTKRFYIYKMGGGFCKGFDDCLQRSKTPLGSTHDDHWLDTINLDSYHLGFSRDYMLNPLMWNWNHVYIMYCDGAYYAGSNSTHNEYEGTPLYFRGADIQSAIFYDLHTKYDFSHSPDTVLGGCSAGGISTYMSIDVIRQHPAVPKQGKLAAIACSGYFLDQERTYTHFKEFTYEIQNTSGMMPRSCVLANHAEPWRCIVAEESAKYIKTPFFVWESRFDSYRLKNSYGKCLHEACAKNKSNLELKSLLKLAWKLKHTGFFLTSCMHHCDDAEIGDVENIRPIRGDIPLVAFYKWYKKHFNKQFPPIVPYPRLWIENARFPGYQSCPSHDQEKHLTWLHDLE